jgi:hypothetical protein
MASTSSRTSSIAAWAARPAERLATLPELCAAVAPADPSDGVRRGTPGLSGIHGVVRAGGRRGWGSCSFPSRMVSTSRVS